MKANDRCVYGGFLKWWVSPTTMGFPTKNDHFGVFWGYHYFRKPPYIFCTLKIIGPSNGRVKEPVWRRGSVLNKRQCWGFTILEGTAYYFYVFFEGACSKIDKRIRCNSGVYMLRGNQYPAPRAPCEQKPAARSLPQVVGATPRSLANSGCL